MELTDDELDCVTGGNDCFEILKKEVISGATDPFPFILDKNAQKNAEISVDAGDGFDVNTLFGRIKKFGNQAIRD